MSILHALALKTCACIEDVRARVPRAGPALHPPHPSECVQQQQRPPQAPTAQQSNHLRPNKGVLCRPGEEQHAPGAAAAVRKDEANGLRAAGHGGSVPPPVLSAGR